MNTTKHTEALKPVRTMAIGYLRTNLFLMMVDLERHATDTVWVGPCETAFDRLAHLFLAAGGDPKLLSDRWPHYFDRVPS